MRRPPLGGIKAVGLGLIRFITIGGHAFQLPGYAFMALMGPNTVEIWPADPHLRILFLTKKSLRFQACFQGLKNQKNSSRGFQKTIKIDPEIH